MKKNTTKAQFISKTGFPEALITGFVKAFGGWGKIKKESFETRILDLSKVDGMNHDKIKSLFGMHCSEIANCLDQCVTDEGRKKLNHPLGFNNLVDRKGVLRAYGITKYDGLIHVVKNLDDQNPEGRANVLAVAVTFLGQSIASRLNTNPVED